MAAVRCDWPVDNFVLEDLGRGRFRPRGPGRVKASCLRFESRLQLPVSGKTTTGHLAKHAAVLTCSRTFNV